MCFMCDAQSKKLVAEGYANQLMDPKAHFERNTDGFEPDGVGDLRLTAFNNLLIVTTDDAADTINTTRTIDVGGAKIISTIDTIGDQDFFKVELVAGKTYDIGQYLKSGGPSGTPLADAFIELYDATGKLIVSADGGGPNTPSGLDALLTFTAQTTGTYFINARAYDNAPENGTTGDFVGDYELFVTDVTGKETYKPYYDVDSPLYSLDWGSQVDGTVRNPDGAETADRSTGNAASTPDSKGAAIGYLGQSTVGKNVIKIYFAKAGDVYTPEDPTSPGLPPAIVAVGAKDFEIEAVWTALGEFEKVADIVYVETQNRDEADFHYVTYSGTPGPGVSLLGSMSPPGESDEGLAQFNSGDARWNATNLAQGGFSFVTLIHEFGHGHGMSHPHDNGGRSGIMRGVVAEGPAFDYTTGDFALNQGVFTMMSYEDGWQASPHGNAATNVGYGYLGGLMAFDIAVIQDKYGVNEEHATGNDTYTLKDENAPGTFFYSIWDAGGTDEIVYNGARNSTIDLRAATLKYEVGGGGNVSYAAGIFGGFTVANGVTIENARSGSGNDTLVGNAAANKLESGAGNDIINLSSGGDDIGIAGAGDDGIFFGSAMTAADEVDGGAGTDQLGLQGNYSGLVFGAKSLVGIEQIVLLPGSDARFGDVSGANYSYNLTTVDDNVLAGQRLVVSFNTLRAGENVTFNGAAEKDGFFVTYGGLGTDVLTGGQQDDGFFFGTGGRFGAADKVDGQGGSLDQLGLQGLYTGANAITFGADQLTSIEQIVLLTGGDTRFGSDGLGYSYDLTTNDANVKAGDTMIITANTLRSDEKLTFDGSRETDGRFRIFSGDGADVIQGSAGADEITGRGGADTITGGLGGDRMTGGDGADTFVYRSAADSTGLSFDTLIGFDYREDKIDLPGQVNGFTGLIETGALNRGSFDSDLAAAVNGALAPNSAVIFKASQGEFAGRSFAVIDADGDGLYNAGMDFVIEIVNPVVPIAPVDDFFI